MSQEMHLNPSLLRKNVDQEPTRNGFGRGLLEAGRRDKQVVALCADLTESTRIQYFAEEFPERYVEVGVAEQNLVTSASGMAHVGKVPFTSSYAAFSPGRNWEQIRTTICLNEQNVKIVGSHAGVSVGPDGATHQMLEDIALMRVLPHMQVISPCDSLQAEHATLAMAADVGPMYIRLAREKTPIITTEKTPFEIGPAYVYREGSDVTLAATGSMVYHALVTADRLHKAGVEAEVINCATIKPFDKDTLLQSAGKTGAVVTLEEAQVNGGLAGTVAETLAESQPTKMLRIGMNDRFGESGQPDELMKHFGLTATDITKQIKSWLGVKTRRSNQSKSSTKTKKGKQ